MNTSEMMESLLAIQRHLQYLERVGLQIDEDRAIGMLLVAQQIADTVQRMAAR